jgi:hypothetical protein
MADESTPALLNQGKGLHKAMRNTAANTMAPAIFPEHLIHVDYKPQETPLNFGSKPAKPLAVTRPIFT